MVLILKIYITILFSLTFALIPLNNLKADESYPFSISFIDYYEGGELIVASEKDSGVEPMNYFVKHGWIGIPDVIYSWQGYIRNNARGNSLNGIEVINAHPLSGRLFTIFKRGADYLCGIIDKDNNVSTLSEIPRFWTGEAVSAVRIIGKTRSGRILFLMDKLLYAAVMNRESIIRIDLISGDVKSAVIPGSMSSSFDFAYSQSKELNVEINFFDNKGDQRFLARLPYTDDIVLQEAGTYLISLSGSAYQSHTQVHIMSSGKGVINTFWVDANLNNILVTSAPKGLLIAYLTNSEGHPLIEIRNVLNPNSGNSVLSTEVPDNLIEPMHFLLIGNDILAIFRNGLSIISTDGKVQASDLIPLGERFNSNLRSFHSGKYIYLSSPKGSMVLLRDSNTFWIWNSFYKDTPKFIFPLVSLLVVIIFLQLYRHEKRLLKELIRLPSAGAVLVFDSAGRLNIANDIAREFFGITGNMPLKKSYDYYLNHSHTQDISDLIGSALARRETIKQKINITVGNEIKEWYCTLVPMSNIAGNFRGIIFTGIDITEQLERKRLSNWAQLAHDMQTNLSTIRLNAEQLDLSDGTDNLERRKKIIQQVSILIRRVRDIVTVGRSDTLDITNVSTEEICQDVRNEFDEALYPTISFVHKAENFSIECDRQKILRALRNAIENAIKALQGKEGTISFECRKDTRQAHLIIKDTGLGMDEDTKNKMLRPYFTTSREKGGAGIGTMIMQQVIDLHGGSITINSQKSVGTEIIFSIPLFAQKRKK